MDVDIVYSIANVYTAAEVILGGVLFAVGLTMGVKVVVWVLLQVIEQFNDFGARWFTW